MTSDVPDVRVRAPGPQPEAAPNTAGDYVLYWMTAFRRPGWNFALQRAADWANEFGKPLVVFEALRVDYRWACDRFHAFVLQGMRDNRDAFAGRRGVTYFPYVEPIRGAGRGLLAALADRAAVVVGDDYPCFFLPAQLRAARGAVRCRFELVDSNGLYPIRATDRVFTRAFDFRRHLQKELLPHLAEGPKPTPLEDLMSPPADGLLDEVLAKWAPVADDALDHPERFVATLPIDHNVKPVAERGGRVAGGEQLRRFLNERLTIYGERRSQPEADAASGLSFWLHWGHLSAHEVFDELARREDWTPARIAPKPNGSSKDWWGMSRTSESFLDELLTWREVGFNMASKRRDYDRYESLPEWARATLAEHASDPRDPAYSLEVFESAKTHDELWNATQRQLAREGRVHNYLRMLWGKKILHWSASPHEALRIMLHLNNKYAVDGRDPNSYSGVFWVLGRYDRPWGPERPIFGKIRYMTCENTARKVSVRGYLRDYGPPPEPTLF